MSEQLEQALDVLAERFGSTGAHLWEQLVRHHVADVVADASMAVVFLAFSSLWAWLCWRDFRDNRQACFKSDIRLGDAGLLLGVVFVAMGLLASAMGVSDMIPVLVAPEGSLLVDLLP